MTARSLLVARRSNPSDLAGGGRHAKRENSSPFAADVSGSPQLAGGDPLDAAEGMVLGRYVGVDVGLSSAFRMLSGSRPRTQFSTHDSSGVALGAACLAP